jgi:hypothetical protein
MLICTILNNVQFSHRSFCVICTQGLFVKHTDSAAIDAISGKVSVAQQQKKHALLQDIFQLSNLFNPKIAESSSPEIQQNWSKLVAADGSGEHRFDHLPHADLIQLNDGMLQCVAAYVHQRQLDASTPQPEPAAPPEGNHGGRTLNCSPLVGPRSSRKGKARRNSVMLLGV